MSEEKVEKIEEKARGIIATNILDAKIFLDVISWKHEKDDENIEELRNILLRIEDIVVDK